MKSGTDPDIFMTRVWHLAEQINSIGGSITMDKRADIILQGLPAEYDLIRYSDSAEGGYTLDKIESTARNIWYSHTKSGSTAVHRGHRGTARDARMTATSNLASYKTGALTMIVNTPATTTKCTSSATTVTGWDTTRISALNWDRPANNNGSDARTASKNAKDGRLSDRVANRGATVVNKVSKGTARVQSQTPGKPSGVPDTTRTCTVMQSAKLKLPSAVPVVDRITIADIGKPTLLTCVKTTAARTVAIMNKNPMNGFVGPPRSSRPRKG